MKTEPKKSTSQLHADLRKKMGPSGFKNNEDFEKMAGLFDMTTDQIINFDGKIPKEVVLEDKTAVEQMKLIQQLDDEDKQTILKLIDKMLTNKKFKDFFQKNVAAL